MADNTRALVPRVVLYILILANWVDAVGVMTATPPAVTVSKVHTELATLVGSPFSFAANTLVNPGEVQENILSAFVSATT